MTDEEQQDTWAIKPRSVSTLAAILPFAAAAIPAPRRDRTRTPWAHSNIVGPKASKTKKRKRKAQRAARRKNRRKK